MKTFIDRLRDRTLEELHNMVKRQKSEIEISQRDLKTMEDVIAEREADVVEFKKVKANE